MGALASLPVHFLAATAAKSASNLLCGVCYFYSPSASTAPRVAGQPEQICQLTEAGRGVAGRAGGRVGRSLRAAVFHVVSNISATLAPRWSQR